MGTTRVPVEGSRQAIAPRTPGVSGIRDAADPNQRVRLVGDTPGPTGVADRGSASTQGQLFRHLPDISRDMFLSATVDGQPVIFEYGAPASGGGYKRTRPSRKQKGDFYKQGDVWASEKVDKDWMHKYVRPRNPTIFEAVVGDYSPIKEDFLSLFGLGETYDVVQRFGRIDRPNGSTGIPSGSFEWLIRLEEPGEILYVPLFTRTFGGRSRGGIMHSDALVDHYWHTRAVDSISFAKACSELALSLTLDLATGVATGIVKAAGRRIIVASARHAVPLVGRRALRVIITRLSTEFLKNCVKALPVFIKEFYKRYSRERTLAALQTLASSVNPSSATKARNELLPALTAASGAYVKELVVLSIGINKEISEQLKKLGVEASSLAEHIAGAVALILAREFLGVFEDLAKALVGAGSDVFNNSASFDQLLARRLEQEIEKRLKSALQAVPKELWRQITGAVKQSL